MSHEMHEAIEQILANGEVPPRVTNRLLLAAMLDLADRADRTEQAVRKLSARLDDLETHPSLLALLWRHPKTTITIIIFIFGLLALAYQAGGVIGP